MKTQFKNVVQILDYFKDEETCKKLLALQRWPEGKPACPFCGNCEKIYTTNRGYKCGYKECGKKFSVTVGTIFENSKIKLRLWYAAIYLLTAHKKGISSHQLARDLGVCQKTGWFILQRVREMLKENSPELLAGHIEIDESYFGGKEKNKHKSKRTEGNQGRSIKTKTPVIGLLERGGKVIAQPVNATDSASLLPVMVANVAEGSEISTDEWRPYRAIGELYGHGFVRHGSGEYVNGKFHTNGIENFWSHFKRGIIGIYHHASRKHLRRYCDEFTYRFNSRGVSDNDRFFATLQLAGNARITYKELTHGQKES